MKKLYVSILALGAFTSMFAQAQVTPKKINGSTLQDAPLEKTGFIADKVSGQFYLDYEAYDATINPTQGVNFTNLQINHRDTAFGTVKQIAVVFDTLLFTDGLGNATFMAQGDVGSLTVDSIFFGFLHENNSGLNDTIITSIVDVLPNGLPGTNVLWQDVTISNTSLSPGTFTVFALTPNFLIPGGSGRFAVRQEFFGPIQDTFRLRAAYPTDGDACVGTSLNNIILSESYPSSHYTISISGGDTSAWLPRLDVPGTANQGVYFFWLDCDGDGDADLPNGDPDPTENPIQHWTLWTSVTVIDNLSINNAEVNGVKLGQNIPNPASDVTAIAFELPSSSDVRLTVTDLSGKIVTTMAIGSKGAGKHTINLDTQNMNAGVYFYTLEAGVNKLTKKMVVAK